MKRKITALTALPVDPPLWRKLPRSPLLSTPELLKVRRCVKHLISHAELKAAAVDFKISTKLFTRTAVNFTRSGSVARLPHSLLLRLKKLVEERPARFAPEPKRESLTKHRIKIGQHQGLQVYAPNRDVDSKNTLMPKMGGSPGSPLAPGEVVMESYQKFSNDLEVLCRQEVTQHFLQRAREIGERRDTIRKAKEAQRKLETELKNKKLLKKALKLGNDFEALKLLASGKLPPALTKIQDARAEILLMNAKKDETPTEDAAAGSPPGGGPGRSRSSDEPIHAEGRSEGEEGAVQQIELKTKQEAGIVSEFQEYISVADREELRQQNLLSEASTELIGPDQEQQQKDLKLNEDEPSEVGFLNGGQVEVVSMIEPGWEKTRHAQAFEYMQFLDELYSERAKIMNPFYFTEKYKQELSSPKDGASLMQAYTTQASSGLLEGPKEEEEEEEQEVTAVATLSQQSTTAAVFSSQQQQLIGVQRQQRASIEERKKATEEVQLNMEAACRMFNQAWSKKLHGRKSKLPRARLT